MSILLTILSIIAAIIALVLIVALVAPKGYSLQRSIVINKPLGQVFEYVKLLRNQENYSKWVMLDPHKRMTYTGTDGTEGFTNTWDSDMKKAGKGEQTITKVVEGERIETRVVFIKPFAGVADIYLTTSPVNEYNTTVTWGFASKMPFPMNAMLLFMNMEKMLGADMEISLNTLKRIMEEKNN
jgi:uncharacterized membrane protein